MRHFLWVLGTIALTLSGCGKDDKVVAGDVPVPILPTTPQNVLLNMIRAYEARDSVASEGVYDVNYAGTSTDLSSPSPSIIYFTRVDEKRHVRALKLDPNIVRVSVDFGAPSTWLRLPPDAADPQDWAVIQIDHANIQIEDLTGFLYQAQNNKMLYTFIPTVHAPGDTTWQIIRWTEIKI